MDKYYFVAYKIIHKTKDEEVLANTVIKNIHPLIWAANPTDLYAQSYMTSLIFWQEIDVSIALDSSVCRYFGSPVGE